MGKLLYPAVNCFIDLTTSWYLSNYKDFISYVGTLMFGKRYLTQGSPYQTLRPKTWVFYCWIYFSLHLLKNINFKFLFHETGIEACQIQILFRDVLNKRIDWWSSFYFIYELGLVDLGQRSTMERNPNEIFFFVFQKCWQTID